MVKNDPSGPSLSYDIDMIVPHLPLAMHYVDLGLAKVGQSLAMDDGRARQGLISKNMRRGDDDW